MKLLSLKEPKRRVHLAGMVLGCCLLTLSACSSNQSSAPSVAPNASEAQVVTPANEPSAFDEARTPEGIAGIGSATVVTVHGTVLAVDRANKTVTLEGPDAKKVTLKVENPYNLEAAQPGMPFVAKFYEIVTIRKKLPGDAAPSVSLSQGIATARPGQTPGAVAGSSVQVVATITGIDVAKETVDLKGPDGSVETVHVANPNNLALVNVGDEIVITLTNAVAISLDKDSGA